MKVYESPDDFFAKFDWEGGSVEGMAMYGGFDIDIRGMDSEDVEVIRETLEAASNASRKLGGIRDKYGCDYM